MDVRECRTEKHEFFTLDSGDTGQPMSETTGTPGLALG